MASFIMHHICGENYLNEVYKKYNIKLSDEEEKQFLLGNLVVDSKTIPPITYNENMTIDELKKLKAEIQRQVQMEKQKTHFRNEYEKHLGVQAPNMNKFEYKYLSLASNNLSVLGYMFHLYTDKLFFEELFPKSFITLDSRLNPTNVDNDIAYFRILKTSLLYDYSYMFSSEDNPSIYNDYTVINKFLLERFKDIIDMDKLLKFDTSTFINPGIEEVDYENINGVIKDIIYFIRKSYETEDKTLKIFRKDDIINFVDSINSRFETRYDKVIKKCLHIKEYTLKNEKVY